MTADKLSLDYRATFPDVAPSPLLVVGYSVGRPAALPEGCPFLSLAMPPLGNADYEIWTGGTATYGQSGRIAFAHDGEVLFGAMSFSDTESLAALAETAYREIFAFIAGSAYPELQRLWNYLPDITGNVAAGERYHLFNLGRHEAFTAIPMQLAAPPAASGVGSLGGAIGIYFMAGKRPTRRIENPRQVSAYNYPVEYGPRSPTFSRAAVATLPGPALLISGTASIVGHTTIHVGDTAAQTLETLRNIETLLDQAGPALKYRPLQAKIYLRYPDDKPLVENLLAAAPLNFGQCLYLQAEICRPELRLEIEAAIIT